MTAAGNGGLIAVNDPEWYDQTLVRRRWGRRSETYLFGSRKGSDDRFGPLSDGTPYDLLFVFDDMGYNFEPSEIMAAYGLVQMDKLPEFNARRQRNKLALDEALAPHADKVVAPRTNPGIETTWMRYPFLLADGIDRYCSTAGDEAPEPLSRSRVSPSAWGPPLPRGPCPRLRPGQCR
jgi:CDP-6-deoxy-D-xylo-4-hexulose-3-dehydrase